jgi:hypothetical protein
VEQLLHAAKAGPVTLPRRETAEAMLAAVALARPSPVPTKSSDQVEVAEVVAPDTMSLPTPEPMPRDATPNGVPVPNTATPSVIQPVQAATIMDLSPVSGEKNSPRETMPDRPSAGLMTEKVPVWEEPSMPLPRVPLSGDERTDPERAQVNVIRTELDRPTIPPSVVRTEPERVVHVRPEPERQRPSRTIVVEDSTGPMQRATEPLPPQPVSTDVNAAHQPEGLNTLVAVGIALLAVSAVVAVWFLLT